MTNWTQRVTAFPGDDTNIRDNFSTLYFASGMPEGVALFRRRSSDGKTAHWLLTPAAAHFGGLLDGDWQITVPHYFDWDLIAGEHSAMALLRPSRASPARPHLRIVASRGKGSAKI